MYRFKVPGMTCCHCKSTIEKGIKNIDPQAEVSVDIEHSEITVRSQANEAYISDTIRAAGYENQKLP